MAMSFEYKVTGGDFTHAGYASSQVKKMLKQLGVDSTVIKRVVVCLYEAEVNIVAHAWDGVINVDPWPFSVDEHKGYLVAYQMEGYPERLDPVILPYKLKKK